MRRHTVWTILLCLLLGLLSAPAARAEGVAFMGRVYAPDTREIDFGAQQVEDWAGLRALVAGLPALEEVRLFGSRVPREVMKDLFDSFPQVFFGFTIRIAEHTIRTDQTAFSTLHNNRSPTHSSQDFEPIRYCTRLQALDLGHNKITDLSFIKDLTGLKVLILAANAIEDISPLASLTQLEYVELFKNRIRDVSAVASWSQVLDLNLAYNLTPDLSPVEGLKTLERLWIYNSNNYNAKDRLKPETLRALSAALPKCYIDAKTYSTGGGWREHPRYFVIFDIFKTSVYKPFEPMEAPWKP